MARPSYPLPGKIYSVVVGVIGYIVLAWYIYHDPIPADGWWYFAVLSVLGLALSAIGTSLPNNSYVSLELLAFYAAGLSLNPTAAAIVALLPPFRRHVTTAALSGWATFRNSAMYALVGIASSEAYRSLHAE